MADCGVTEFMQGGMIAEAHVTSSAITESRVTSSDLKSCNLQTLTSIDEDSAQTIADAIAKLPSGMLAELGKAIAAVLPAAPLSSGPREITGDTLPSTVAGSREVLLGRPAAWLGYRDFIVPCYKEGQV